MMIQYKETKLIDDKDLRQLYESQSWKSYLDKFDDLSILLQNCQIVYSAWDNETLVGLVRTVGDGVSIQYVQDLLVLPKYQKLGIGGELMKHVFKKSEHIRQLVLITDAGVDTEYVRNWYEKQGLVQLEKADIKGFLRLK